MASRCGLGRPGSLCSGTQQIFPGGLLCTRPQVWGTHTGQSQGPSAVGSLEEIVQSGRLT